MRVRCSHKERESCRTCSHHGPHEYRHSCVDSLCPEDPEAYCAFDFETEEERIEARSW